MKVRNGKVKDVVEGFEVEGNMDESMEGGENMEDRENMEDVENMERILWQEL